MGKLVLIIGPSASGKTSLVNELLQKIPHSTKLVTTTTRESRAGEIDGKDLFFISREKFEEGI